MWLAPVRGALALVALLLAPITSARAENTPSPFNEKEALAYSQAALGREVGSFRFLNRKREVVDLKDFRGKPLVISLVYTSCFQTCPSIVQSLYEGIEVAQEALGKDSFNVVTIGFDVRYDTPERMRAFAMSQGAKLPNWYFLSGDKETVDRLTKLLGFIYFPSPKGFDHLTQVTIVDQEGKVYTHVYGATFAPPTLVEPLKELVFGRRRNIFSFQGLSDRIRLFCTIYDPNRERYYFDYSIFVGMFIGLAILTTIAFIILKNLWRLFWESRST